MNSSYFFTACTEGTIFNHSQSHPCGPGHWLQNVPTDYRLNSLVQLLQQLVQVYRQGTGYTALYTCFNNWFQSVLTGTDYTALYTCFNNWLQSVPAGTGYTALYTCFNLPVTSLQTGCWLHSPYCTGLHPNWLHRKSWLNIDQ